MRPWLPEPERGTPICLGFDGSDVDDFTALRAETRDGFRFTPRHGDGLPTIWNPAEWAGTVPRASVTAALEAIFERFVVSRFYYDPPRWESDGEKWALMFGEDRVASWPTYRTRPMHEALARYATDMSIGTTTHDGCPITTLHAANARKIPRGDRFILGKPSQHQKIDAVMADVLAHEAAADARAAGWNVATGPTYFRLPR